MPLLPATFGHFNMEREAPRHAGARRASASRSMRSSAAASSRAASSSAPPSRARWCRAPSSSSPTSRSPRSIPNSARRVMDILADMNRPRPHHRSRLAAPGRIRVALLPAHHRAQSRRDRLRRPVVRADAGAAQRASTAPRASDLFASIEPVHPSLQQRPRARSAAAPSAACPRSTTAVRQLAARRPQSDGPSAVPRVARVMPDHVSNLDELEQERRDRCCGHCCSNTRDCGAWD